MQLKLIQKPASEIITLEETKNYLRVDHNYDDALILDFIKATREAIEAIIQKSIMKQVWEYHLDNSSICKFDFGDSNYPSIFGDIIRIPLPKPPVMHILSVLIDGKECEGNKYFLEKVSSQFCLCINCKRITGLKRKIDIQVTYEAGIADTVENVPYQLKLANLMLVANAYQERFTYKQSSVISKGVRQLLDPFLNLRIF
ncbi:MAG: head-tail connector protein [Alphaproteobacteria bacterium]|nr:head-tail connector protein [Alphaproteobacteria bacterium]